MRRLSVCLLLVLVQSLLPGFAGAATGPGNSWTQWDNHNWPDSSSNPACSPCVRWTVTYQAPNGYFESNWGYLIHGNTPDDDRLLHNYAQAAMAGWSSQQYRSPVFREDSGGCNDSVCMNARPLGDLCGQAQPSPYQGYLITHMEVDLNSNQQYTDGAGGTCDLRTTYLHEVGHAFSEGHSAIAADLMFHRNNDMEDIDGDAQRELNAVYGPTNNGGGSGGPCPCLDALKAKLAFLSKSLFGVPTMRRITPAGS